MAIGFPGEPVAPFKRSGLNTKQNSCTPAAASSFEIQVFEMVHAVLREVPLVNRKRQVGALVREGLDRPGIGPDQRDLPIGQKLGRREADARFARAVGRVVFHPQFAVPGADQNDVAFLDLQVRVLQARSQLVRRNDISRRKPVLAAEAQTSSRIPRVKKTPAFSTPSFFSPYVSPNSESLLPL